MTSRDEVVESLKRQVSSLSFQLARVISEHDQELNKKDQLRKTIVLQRDQRFKKTDAQLADMRSEQSLLKRSLNTATFELQAKTHQVRSLQEEVATLCSKLDTETKRVQDLKEALTNQSVSANGRSHRVRAKKQLMVGRARLQKCMKAIKHVPAAHVPARAKSVDNSTRSHSPPPSTDAARGTCHPEGGGEDGSGECGGVGCSGGEGDNDGFAQSV